MLDESLDKLFQRWGFSGSTSRGNWRGEKASGKENVETGVNKGRAESSVTRSSDIRKEYLLLKGCLSVV